MRRNTATVLPQRGLNISAQGKRSAALGNECCETLLSPARAKPGIVICRSPALIVGGFEDHIHALFLLSKNHPLKKIVEEVKKGSSKWMKAEGTGDANFYWQNGYAAFSVSQSKVDEVRSYIEHQAEHHRRIKFQDELRELLRRHGIEFDERYVWD